MADSADPDPAALLLREDPALPLALVMRFGSLCRPPDDVDLATDAARLRVRRRELLGLAERYEFDLEKALAIAESLLAAIEGSPSLTGHERLLLGGAVEYFLLLGDEQPDLATPDGFEDDRVMANAVFAAIGRPELAVPESQHAFR